MTSWENGDRRETGRITLFFEDSMWKAQVKDADSAQIAFVSGECPDDLLGALDIGLETGKLDWRPDQYAKKKPKGKG